MKNKIKKWLIKKIAGDTFVLLNATIIYKYYTIFADTEKNPIIDKCKIIQSDISTPFMLYASHVFKEVDGNLIIVEKYKDAYEKVIDVIKANQDQDKDEILEDKDA